MGHGESPCPRRSAERMSSSKGAAAALRQLALPWGYMQARGCQIFRYFKNSLKSGLRVKFSNCVGDPSSHLLESLCLFCFYHLKEPQTSSRDSWGE